MKKIIALILSLAVVLSFPLFSKKEIAHADTSKTFYTVYSDKDKTKILFTKGDDITTGDKYLSHENDLYEIESVDDNTKTAIAKFLKKEELPKISVKKKKRDTLRNKSNANV